MIVNDANVTREIHVIHNYLCYYKLLLDDFRQTLHFILCSPNPTMSFFDADRQERDRKLLHHEVGIILAAVEGLEQSRSIQIRRVKNVANLVRSSSPSFLNDSQS